MKKQNVNTAAETDEIRGIFLQAFDHAAETLLNEDTRAEALQLTRLYFGEDATENGEGFKLMTGFLMGMSEGMRIADVLEKSAE